MGRFIEGEHRHQATLFPNFLDDYVGEDKPVRVVEVFVEELDLFDSAVSSARFIRRQVG